MNKTVVVIDDDFDDYTFLKEAIEEYDPTYTCLYHNDSICGMEAMMALEADHPGYIFIDINMPKATGDECLRTLRSNKAFDKSVIVMFSTFMSEEFTDAMLSDGANHAFKKPNTMNGYLTLLRQILKTDITPTN